MGWTPGASVRAWYARGTRCGTCRVRMRTTRRKTLVNARSRSRVRTDGRTVRYERQSRRVDGRFDAWLGVSWRAVYLRTGLDLERLYDRPSGHAIWTARSLTFYVLSYACAHGRCHNCIYVNEMNTGKVLNTGKITSRMLSIMGRA